MNNIYANAKGNLRIIKLNILNYFLDTYFLHLFEIKFIVYKEIEYFIFQNSFLKPNTMKIRPNTIDGMKTNKQIMMYMNKAKVK